jgi:hypothetical protein
MDDNIPKEPGFYWAKSDKEFKWFNLIVKIYGDIPYLRFTAWNLAKDSIEEGNKPNFIFGSKIERDI